MSVLAVVRPDSWNLPLLLHIAGAMVLVGGVLTAVSALALANGDGRLLRLGHRALLLVGLPGYVVMRGAAEWIADKEGYNDKGAPEPDWLGIGYIVADAGILLLLVALVLGGLGLRRMRNGKGGEGQVKAMLILSVVLLVAYTVAVWAMSAKPG